MILTRAPLRVSWVGGGSDLPSHYRKSNKPGRVISTTFNKYVYIVINPTPLVNKVSARYSVSETVDRPEDLKHTRIKAALLDLGIRNKVEIGSYGDLPAKTGLGSSSSFTVAMLKALYLLKGGVMLPYQLAEKACALEMDMLHEPIGKQDQYAAALGGFNVFAFNSDGSVKVEPVSLGYKERLMLESHFVLFFTGITRDASSVLTEQNSNADKNMEIISQMADSVFEFRENLLAGNMKRLGEMLHEGWTRKRTLATSISNSIIDDLYAVGMSTGAWGGKVFGAGGGGCIGFITSNKEVLREKIFHVAHKIMGFTSFVEIPVRFTQDGASVLFHNESF